MNGAGAAVTVLSRDARDDHPNGTDLGAAPDDRLPTHAAASDGIPQLLPFQARVRRAYLWHPVQFGIAAVIFANFVTTAIDKQMRPADGSPTALAIANAEIFFAAVFGLELIANLYAHWLRPFFSSCARRLRARTQRAHDAHDARARARKLARLLRRICPFPLSGPCQRVELVRFVHRGGRLGVAGQCTDAGHCLLYTSPSPRD